MQREINARTLDWADKTMSLIQQRQLEACESRLGILPDFGLFLGCNDENAEQLWEISYEAEEHPQPTGLHTADDLIRRVMLRLPSDSLLLPVPEAELVRRLLLDGGHTELSDWSEITAAESLVKRLWCTISTSSDQAPELKMPQEIVAPLTVLTQLPGQQMIRKQVMCFFLTVLSALSLNGMIYAADAYTYLDETIPHDGLPFWNEACWRALRTAFDYMYARDGSMVLVHPGMADPHHLLAHLQHIPLSDYAISDPEADMPQILLSNGERQCLSLLSGLIADSLRPELMPAMAVEDLRILAKQQVDRQAMAEVLASQLTVRPTKPMLDALDMLRAQTTAWTCIPNRRIQ